MNRNKGIFGSIYRRLKLLACPRYLLPDLATLIEGEITFVESQGREILYDLTLAGGQVFRSIQSNDHVCKLGDRIRWRIDADAIFIFDKEGNRI